METSDSSHSGIVGGVRFLRRVGLEGAEAAKIGRRVNDLRDWHPFERDSKSGFLFELLLEVGDERGGVTGALLEIFSRGRFVGIEAMFWRKGRRYVDGLFPSKRVGLGKDDEVGLAW